MMNTQRIKLPSKSNLLYDNWILKERKLVPEQLNYKETTFTIGNGYLGTRGSFEEDYPGSNAATLINGVYDDVPVYLTELANCPNWLPLNITVGSEEFRLDRGEILSYERKLDLSCGLLTRKVRWRSPKGRTLDIKFERFASMADKHVLAIRLSITPINFDGDIKVLSSIDGTPENEGFNHFVILEQGYTKKNNSVWLQCRTRKSKIELGMASKLVVHNSTRNPQNASVPEVPALAAKIKGEKGVTGKTYTFEKLVTVVTSRESLQPLKEAQEKLSRLPDFEQLLKDQQEAWKEIWEKSDVVIEGNRESQLIVRYNLFQLLIAAPRDDERVSIPAKNLSGFGYRGHVFWDTEFFMLPYLIHTQPQIARNILTYRYHTLPGAKRKAIHYGYRGAMYAWESADTGDEVTPRWGMSGEPYAEDLRVWCREREIHISAVIAFACWWFWYSTNDHEWMRDYGAEIILETALFWSSRVDYDAINERWSIRGVIGPDEYHDNVDDNAFTNQLVQINFESALEVLVWLQEKYPEKAEELIDKLEITPKRRSRWKDIQDNIWIPFDEKTGLVEQFDGYFKLKDLNLEDMEPRTRSMQSILGMEGANDWQIIKQPDVLMLLILMGAYPKGDQYSKEVIRKNWEYYTPRTDISYGSSLGPGMQALVAAELGMVDEVYDNLKLSALVDLEDNRGNTDEGIHGASCGNIWQAVIFGIAGVHITEDGPKANPNFPPGWTRLKFKLHWRGKWYDFDLKPEKNNIMKQIIKGFIFDLDGVITDTAEYHYQAWQQLADEEGLTFNREMNETLRGVSRRDSLMKIIGDKKYSNADIEKMMFKKNELYKELVHKMTPEDLLPGALELIEELKANGIKIALGSASKNAKTVLDRLQIATKFDFIADGFSVANSKPAPDLFLFAAEKLHLKPEECVVVEDAAAGIEAALAGGMHAVGLGPEDRVGAAHLVLPNLKGAKYSQLLEGLSSEKVKA